MIPLRFRGALPDEHFWLIFKDPRPEPQPDRLIVVLSDLLPRGLEQDAVKAAVKGWKREQRRIGGPLGLGIGAVLTGPHAGKVAAAATATTAVAVIAGYALTGALRTHPTTHPAAPPEAVAPTPARPHHPAPGPLRLRTPTPPPRSGVPVTTEVTRSTPRRTPVARHHDARTPGHGAPRVRTPAGPPIVVIPIPPVHVPPPGPRPVAAPMLDVQAATGGHLAAVRVAAPTTARALASVRVGSLVHLTL